MMMCSLNRLEEQTFPAGNALQIIVSRRWAIEMDWKRKYAARDESVD
jgi:hypothetical protein